MTYWTLSPGVKDLTLNGPVPIGFVLIGQFFGSVQAAICAFCRSAAMPERYHVAVGYLKVITIVVASGVSTVAMAL